MFYQIGIVLALITGIPLLFWVSRKIEQIEDNPQEDWYSTENPEE